MALGALSVEGVEKRFGAAAVLDGLDYVIGDVGRKTGTPEGRRRNAVANGEDDGIDDEVAATFGDHSFASLFAQQMHLKVPA